MYFLGIDIASVNPGYSIIKGSKDIVFSKTIKTPNEFKVSDALKCAYQKQVLEKLLNLQNYAAICVESPAFSFSNRMVSIGMIHGAILSNLIGLDIPVVYCPPTKWKYALLGKGSASKEEGISFVLSNFRFSKGVDFIHYDDNQADSAMLAHMAYVFHRFANGEKPEFFEGTDKRVIEIFTSEKYSSSKKSGILFRKNEFYFNTDLLWQ